MQNQLNLVKGINRQELMHISTVSGEGTFALDQSGQLLTMNEEAERLLGWHASELEGLNFFNRVNFKMRTIENIGSSSCAAIKSVGCSHLHNGASLTSKDGSIISISFISLPVFDCGKMYGKVFVFCEAKDSAASSVLYRSIVESTGSIILKLDLQGKIEFANELAKKIFGEKLEHLIPTSVGVTLRENSDAYNFPAQMVNRVKTIEGQIRQIAWSVKSIAASASQQPGVVCVGNDITLQDTRRDALLPDRQMADKVFEFVSDGVITVEQSGIIKYLNPVAEQLTGWTSLDARGLMLNDVFHVVDNHSRQPMVESILALGQDTYNQKHSLSHTLLRHDGWEFVIEESIAPVRDKNGMVLGFAIVFRDISEVCGMDHSSSYESSHDGLTGLINRTEFESHITQALSTARADGRQHAFCHISIELFEDDLSLPVHDDVVKQAATMLYKKVRDTDVLARIGENEFGVLLKNCSLENAREASQIFCDEISRHKFISQDCQVDLGANIGLVPVTSGAGGLVNVMRIADAACYVARDKGRNRVHLYGVQDITLQFRQNELEWVHRIRRGLEDNRFRLYCQSIVPLGIKNDDSAPVHHEILLRMLDDNEHVVGPSVFIPAAERYNLMPSIDRWVVRNALNLLGEKIERNLPLGIFAINLSAQSLVDDSFLGFVVDQLDKSQVPAENICFEITETTAISNLMVATRIMSILRGMGCKFALDDFGRGFSSYSYLKNLKVDYLKIDGSFVRDLANDPVDHAMVESINHIGHIMGVETIAEFVETEEILEKLITLGVDHAQGYQLGKPRPMWHSVNLALPVKH